MKVSELFGGWVVFLGLAASTAWASDGALPIVGRISAVAGPVQYQSAAGAWSDALANEPVAAGTGLRTAPDAEAEWRRPDARVALAPSSELRVVRSEDDALQIVLVAGRIGVHLDAARNVEIDLPHGGVWLDAPGDYDIVAGDAHDPARIEIFAGTVRLGGGLDNSHIAAVQADSFSDWWRSQDDNAAAAAGRQLPDIAGVAALDATGRWETDPKFGKIWYPSGIAADWTPYRDGVWRFLAPWGWTWIDHEAWGFAPTHYGRWARIDDRWGWVPGPQLTAADYSAATVAFLGTAGIGLSRPGDAGSAIAWFPLAPGEMIGDGDDANYKNRRFGTAVPRAAFAAGQPVAAALIDDVPERRFADAPVILGALDISPTNPALVAASPRKPAVVTLAAAARPAPAAPPETARRRFAVQLRAAVTRDTHKRLRVAAAIVVRSRSAASTSALRSPHNRAHLAAARGGA
jgi:hypothetical protein